jgi:hypothetical protein
MVVDLEKVEDFVFNNSKGMPLTADTDHPWRVAEMTNTFEERVVALLHDEVEDGLATWEQIEDLLDVPHGSRDDEMLEALRLLTRNPKYQSYQQYVDAISESGNQLAINVKIYDIMDHLDPVRRDTLGKKAPRYIKALKSLLIPKT